MKTLTVVLLLSTLLYSGGYCARILALYATSGKSHKISVMPILEELARRGHEITIVSPYEPAKKIDNIREIVLSELENSMSPNDINWFEMPKQGITQVSRLMLTTMRQFVTMGIETLMENEEFRAILQEGQVDLIIYNALFNQYSSIIAGHLRVPYVTHCSASGLPGTLAVMGAPMDYASVPFGLSDYDNKMTFFQRMANMMQAEMFELIYKFAVTSQMEQVISKYLPNARPIDELEREISLTIINSHPATAWPRSLPPTIVPIGALHTRPAKSLPSEFETFANQSTNGLIVFTLGSAIPVSTMPKDILQAFLNVFSKLPQNVIWKWEIDPPANLPPNVMISKWLPQQDLLGHSNTVLFITHGGLQGTQEAIYHAVPLLFLPFGNDQKANAKKGTKEGFGLSLDWSEITKDVLFDSIVQLIYTKSFKENVTRLSRMMKDEPMPGREVAAYWVEYVLRHGGTKHLQVASKNMPFYQRYLLDVIGFLIMASLIPLYLCYRTIRWILLKCLLRPATQKQKTN